MDVRYVAAGVSASGTARDLRKLRLRIARPRSGVPGKQLRVLVHVPEYPPTSKGGAEQSIRAITNYLAAAGHEVTVVVESIHDPYSLDGVLVTPAGSRRTLRMRYRQSDVAISQRKTALRCQMMAGTEGIPFVLCVRDVGDWLRLPVLPDLTVFNARFQRDLFDFKGRSVVVYPPVDLDQVKTTPGDRITLINLNERKGAGLFLDVASLMPEQLFLGVKGIWGTQIVPKEPLPNLELIDAVADPREIYSQTRILLLPSRWESFGRVAVEAGVSGIPVVATPNPGTVEALGDAAIFAPADDPSAWVEAIRRLDDESEYRAWSSKIGSAVEYFRSSAQLAELEEALKATARG